MYYDERDYFIEKIGKKFMIHQYLWKISLLSSIKLEWDVHEKPIHRSVGDR